MVSKTRQLIKDVKEAGEYKKPVLAQEIIRKGYQRGVKSSKETAGAKRVSQIVRKAVSLAAPKGSIIRAATTTTKKKGSRGRGRPSGTYKVRYLPSGKAVKVPTHIYKKMLSAEKSQMRLAKAQQMAQVQMQADQMAMGQDPRYQMGADDQFLAEPDQQHEMDVMMAQQRAGQQADMQQADIQQAQQYQQQRPSVGRRIIDRVGSMRIRNQGYVDEYGRPQVASGAYGARQVASLQRPNIRMGGIVREPRVTAVSGKADLLRTPRDIERNPEQSMLTEHRDLNFFSNRQPVRVPDRSKLTHFNKAKRGVN